MFNLNKKDFRKLDLPLIMIVLSLIISGLVVLHSAISPSGDNIKTQIVSTIIGAFLFLFIYCLDLDIFKKLKWLIYLIIIGLLVYTIFFGIGAETWGANLWVRIGPLTVQPSEFVKVLLILFLGSFINSNAKKVNTLEFFIKYFLLAGIPVAMIIKQGDLGTGMVVFFIVVVMYFMSGINMKTTWLVFGIALLILTLGLAIGLPLVWDSLASYQQDRILNFIDPSRDILGSGLQMERGYIAIGSGQLSGRGYQSGPMSQNSYIPEQHTDFIFPVLIEEFGFIGGIFVIGLYLLMLLRMLII